MNPEEFNYVLHCSSCPYKRFSTGMDLDDLIQVKTVDLQKQIPRYDPLMKKTVVAPNKKRTKMFRCPKCGFTLKSFKINKDTDEQTNRTD
jgi:protein-arginine kinase activator protein McsA